MTVRDFQGISSLQEAECSGRTLGENVNYLSLTLFRKSDNVELATYLSTDNTCETYQEYSSCTISPSDIRKSVVKTLVSDLKEGGSVILGCNVTSVSGRKHPNTYSWIQIVRRQTESKIYNKMMIKSCYKTNYLEK